MMLSGYFLSCCYRICHMCQSRLQQPPPVLIPIAECRTIPSSVRSALELTGHQMALLLFIKQEVKWRWAGTQHMMDERVWLWMSKDDRPEAIFVTGLKESCYQWKEGNLFLFVLLILFLRQVLAVLLMVPSNLPCSYVSHPRAGIVGMQNLQVGCRLTFPPGGLALSDW